MTKPIGNFLSSIEEDRLNMSRETAEIRRSNFVKAIPAELSQREDNIQAKLAKENASPRSKLRKIYNLMTDLGNVSASYIACTKGCSSCCKMNVTISQIEANQIAEKTGIKAKQLANSIDHNSEKFIGIPCMFLIEDSCSIYEDRPFVCRKHVWFDISSYWCAPERSLSVAMPMLEYSGALAAYSDVTNTISGGVHADIRDFFGI